MSESGHIHPLIILMHEGKRQVDSRGSLVSRPHPICELAPRSTEKPCFKGIRWMVSEASGSCTYSHTYVPTHPHAPAHAETWAHPCPHTTANQSTRLEGNALYKQRNTDALCESHQGTDTRHVTETYGVGGWFDIRNYGQLLAPTPL